MGALNGLNFFKQFLYDPKNPLLFNSGFFLFYLVFFFFCYSFFHQNKKQRIASVIAFSLYFFYKACGYYVVLVLISAVVDFNLSRFIYLNRNKTRRNQLLFFSILINLSLLFYFKYTDFFISILNQLRDKQLSPLQLILPIGISFYTFENISYTVDVYRGKFKPIKSFWEYLFFLSFFPKLIMGPIVRAADFIPQISRPFSLNSKTINQGFYLICAGLFKKVVISDYIQVNFVQYIFDDPSLHTGLECLLAVYAYALVIYCDFSGYSDMAIGIGKWMGFDINVNFLSPYQSSSITEFWRRWHISLSSWLKDYLYIPLGGNRKGSIRQYINLGITMLIGGLWHGANWTFVFWGAFHGIALGLDKLWGRFWSPIASTIQTNWKNRLVHGLSVLFTFHLVCFAWVFFKAKDFETAGVFLNQILHNFQANVFTQVYINYRYVILTMCIGFILHFIPQEIKHSYRDKLEGLSAFKYALLLSVFIILLIQVKTAQQVMPVYLQF
ncbi:MAG: membrane-bound O-acyltransferase family protein [Bacteroidetes bacterium B1(2017)]|nr:MAG: membrane-bound O-acyltransferase family protein [Bacteroidetes bacterium B1(2017)]